MARIAKYLLGAAATVVIALGAVAVAREAGLLAGSLVVLAALIATTLASRQIARREERSAMADWEDVLEKDAPADAFFSDWTATSPRTAGLSPARPDDELDLTAHTAAGLESLDDLAPPAPVASVEELDLTDAFGPAPEPVSHDDQAVDVEAFPAATADLSADPAVVDEPTEAPTFDQPVADAPADEAPIGLAAGAPAPAPADHHDFPFDDPYDGFGDFAGLPPLPGRSDQQASDEAPADPFTTPEPFAPAADPYAPAADPYAPAEPFGGAEPFAPAADLHRGTPTSDPGGLPPGGLSVPDLAPLEADAYSFAGAPSPSRSRRSVIDWSGPIHSVDEHVRSAEDILEASAATALPTPADRPAPTGGSELARLLAKVEERLRDYD